MATPTKTIIGSEARKAVLDGVDAIYEPVRRTLGPEARKALLFRTFNRGSRIVDDGYAVAEAQEPKNVHVRLAAQSFKEACKRTNEKVGDGTATTGVIGGVLFHTAYKLVEDDKSDFTAASAGKMGVSQVRRAILSSAAKVKDEIRKRAVTVQTQEELENVARISVGDEALGKIVAGMAWKVGVDGYIDVVEGYKGEIEQELIEGMRFPGKLAGKAFCNVPQRFEMVAEDCPVLLTNYGLDNATELATVLQRVNKETSKLVVIAPSFSDNVLINMINAAKKGGYFIYPVAVPALRTEQYQDLEVYFDARFIDKNKGMRLQNVNFVDLGFVQKIVVKDVEAKEDVAAIGGAGTIEEASPKDGGSEKVSPIAKRIAVLKSQLAETREEPMKKLMERRIASMASAVGIIRVGSSTQAESLDVKMKIEDAVYACKAALKGGYVKGGGLCLKEIAQDVLDKDDVMFEALCAPYNQIQDSVEGGIEVGADVIDPADAEYYAVEHASAVVANLITVETITPEMEGIDPGESNLAIARMLGEYVLFAKRQAGLIQENQEEQERDRLGGISADERMSLDNG